MRCLSLLALLSLTGCATTEYIRELPPAELLAECEKPAYDKTTNRGIVLGLVAYDQALALCNNDKAALREWASTNSKGERP